MSIESKFTVASLLGTYDSSIKVVKTINRPYIKQFAVLSKNSTVSKPSLYNVKFELNTPKITPQSKIKVYCDCMQFRYRLAFCFNENDALLMPASYVIEPPDKTNPGCKKLEPCKHIRAALKYALEHKI
jgi:hypothetical protein